MNLDHLRATLWLRWRILRNRFRRKGKWSNVGFCASLILVLIAAVGSCVTSIRLGLKHLPEAEPEFVMLAWIVLAMTFLGLWSIGVASDLKRSDSMSIKNLLHLPTSLGWVFVYNYLSSFVSLSIAVFLPAMLGLWVAMAIVYGAPMLFGLALVASFFVLVTSLTYQFRGWFAHLMEDKRRGRNTLAILAVIFLVFFQALNLNNLGQLESRQAKRRQEFEQLIELGKQANKPGPEQQAFQDEISRRREKQSLADLPMLGGLFRGARILPPGWLPYGMRAMVERRWLPAGLCLFGMLLISAASLRRSFRKTILMAVGAPGRVSVAQPASTSPRSQHALGPAPQVKPLLVEQRISWVSEAVAGIALGNLKSLLRAPESKMLLARPVILLGFMGVMLSRNASQGFMEELAPLMSLGITATLLLTFAQLIQNQFGFDRAGFRAYMLSPVPRARILLGKNLATAPLALGTGLLAIAMLQFMHSMDLPHLIGAGFQLVSAYLLISMLGNMISILSPMRIKEGGLRNDGSKLTNFLWQLLSVLLTPITLAPLALPLAIEFLVGKQGWAQTVPLYLVLHALGLAAIFVIYRWVLHYQGALLQEREQRMLVALTTD